MQQAKTNLDIQLLYSTIYFNFLVVGSGGGGKDQ